MSEVTGLAVEVRRERVYFDPIVGYIGTTQRETGNHVGDMVLYQYDADGSYRFEWEPAL